MEFDTDLLEIFSKVEINIPLLDAILHIPKYAKFMKELCTHKRKLKGNEQVNMGRSVSALTQSKSVFSLSQSSLPIPCTIGSHTFIDAMLDLGASINVMPTSVYRSLCLGDLKLPLGVLEDVPVRVQDLIFRADFYILDMQDESPVTDLP